MTDYTARFAADEFDPRPHAFAQLIRLAFQNGAGLILAAPVAADTTEAYTSAIALLMAEKRASFVLTDSVCVSCALKPSEKFRLCLPKNWL